MRSFVVTILLGAFALLATGVAAWHFREGNFHVLWGPPPVAVGERVYRDFSPAQVKRIKVSQRGTSAIFELKDNQWQALAPWQDRMDSRAANAMINFALTMRVEDSAPVDDMDPATSGLGDGAVEVRLYSNNQNRLARFKIGRRTPWLATVKDIERPVPTVFVQPSDDTHRRYVYTCTGDITALFKDGMRFLRDHHPLAFDPAKLQSIRIRSAQGNVVLRRESQQSPWRVVSPIELPTSPKAMGTLLNGLRELQAAKITDSTTPPPTADALSKTWEIALEDFNGGKPITLEIIPPTTPQADLAQATASNRPGMSFDLPLHPRANAISLADLPLAVNDLRDPALAQVDFSTVRAIRILPARGPAILISPLLPSPRVSVDGGATQPANEERLLGLLKAIKDSKATGFESDAATDFTPWGLNRPFLRVAFEGDRNFELRFGTDGKGGFFANREGSPVVMSVDSALFSAIPVLPYEWRHSRVWSLDRTNLVAIERATAGAPAVEFHYNNDTDEWTASRKRASGPPEDLTSVMDATRAAYVLGVLEGVKVSRWLPVDDAAALAALATPSLSFTVTENQVDDDFKLIGKTKRQLIFAPASQSARPGFYFGCLVSDGQPFLLDAETYSKLATEIIDPEALKEE